MTHELSRLTRFLAVGLMNTGFGYACYALFIALHLPLWLAVAVSTILAVFFNFGSYGHLVFGSKSHRLLPRFVLCYAGLGLLNLVLLRCLVGAGAGPFLAQALLLPLLAAISYIAMRRFVFGGVDAGDTKEPFSPGHAEEFKPVPVRIGEGRLAGALFRLRMAGDLQLLTCMRFLRPHLTKIEGSILDVGCGEMPFRSLLQSNARYTGLDVPQAADFGMRQRADIVAFDGEHIPFPDESFDHVMCVEVLEHAEAPDRLLNEIRRVLKPGGSFFATVPFSARVHHAPFDFHRFTRFRLAALFADFGTVEISERGDDLAVIANKLIVVCARLAKQQPFPTLAARWAALIALGPLTLFALLIAHLSLIFGWGSRMDPLGYSILARKQSS